MKILIKERGEGKTTVLMNWIKKGERVRDYPGWSRVAVILNERSYLDLKRQYWGEIEDFDHRVYQLIEFDRGRFGFREDIEYRIDDMDLFIRQFFHIPNITGFTITGSTWEDE